MPFLSANLRRIFSLPPREIAYNNNPPPNGLVNFHYRPNDQSTPQQIQDTVKANSIRTAVHQLFNINRQPNVFAVGDWVRVKYTTIDNAMRQRHKENLVRKRSAIRYSLDVYRVSNVIPQPIILNGLPQNQIWNIARQSYNLTLNGVLEMTGGYPSEFFASDLIHVLDPAATEPLSVVPATHARMRFINRF